MTPINAVMGFLFNYNCEQVVLIKKNRPSWQCGLLNGVGGKIEAEETSLHAMQREFEEETGLQILAWKYFCTLKEPEWNVEIFTSLYPVIDLTNEVKTITDEEIIIINDLSLYSKKVISNLLWLIPMAKDTLIEKRLDFMCVIKYYNN